MKFPVCLQFRRAICATRHVLLQFITGIICQLVINVEQKILLDPFTFHTVAFLQLSSQPKPKDLALYRISANAPLSFCVARNKVFFAVSSVVCKISPTVRSFNP